MVKQPTRTVLVGARVYAPAFPHATAIILEQGIVSWVGDEDGLTESVASDDDIIDCGGGFLGPAFFDASLATDELPADHAGGQLAEAPEILLVRDRAGEVTREVVTTRDRYVNVVTPADDIDPELMGGGSFALGSAGAKPGWALVAHAVLVGGVTTRSAFNAATRGGWRHCGLPHRGVVAPGELAQLCVWSCDAWDVPRTDQRVSRWSTDPRSGQPQLPNLAGPTLPTLKLSIYGRQVRRWES